MYIRLKRIKTHKYAYLVKNKRYKRKKTPRQITVKYLGKIYCPKKVREERLVNNEVILTNSAEIIEKLIEIELKNHGFEKKGVIWIDEDIIVDIGRKRVFDKEDRPRAIEVNEGFLTDYTLSGLLNYKYNSKIPLITQGKRFADILISCGINIEKELFLRLFEKIHKS